MIRLLEYKTLWIFMMHVFIRLAFASGGDTKSLADYKNPA